MPAGPSTTRCCDLGGRGVLITRPIAQAEGLCRLVEATGGKAIRFPAIAIEPFGETGPARELLARSWDSIIFTSRNAVEQALPLFSDQDLPAGTRLGAVGAATASALEAAGRAPDFVPAGRFDSESLLALPELADLTGRRILIVRGEGGRDLLRDGLLARGAELAYAEVYRRVLPKGDPAPLLARWRQDIQLITATSGEILDNLLTLVGVERRGMLLTTPLVVVSERTAKAAERIGFDRVELADRASDAAILDALCRLVEQ